MFLHGWRTGKGCVILFFNIVVLLIAVEKTEAKTLIVCPSCPVKSIKTAILNSTEGDEILLKEGHYAEYNIEIKKGLKLYGEKGSIVDGSGEGTIFKISADNVALSGLTIRNVGHSYTVDYAAILINNAKNFTIKNNILEKVFFGVKIEKSSNGKISQNIISSDAKTEAGTGNGIHAWYSSKLEIEDNRIFSTRDGIYFEFVNDSKIENNVSHNNVRYGLHFMFSHNNRFINNQFYENGAGVAVMYSKDIFMGKNIFRYNWGSASFGLLLKDINDSIISDNSFYKNSTAINIEGANRVEYKNNTFLENGWAIMVRGASYENTYTKNNFTGNAFDVAYHGDSNDFEFNGNYWSAYTGYDLNKDGIGDIPHRPVKFFSYIVSKNPESIILLRSLFMELIDVSEKVSPIFTPSRVIDNNPSMKKFQ